MEKTIEIIIIEDEEDILELLEYHLQKEGYETVGFLSTENVERFLEEESPSLMIIDRNLPGVEGSDFVSYIRNLGYDIPVIFLTAKDQEGQLVEGYERGGDDYMTKPFSTKELLLRVKALLKRSGALASQEKIKYRDITLDIEKKIASIGGEPLFLTRREFDLLHVFVRNPNKPLTRDFLREEAWGSEGDEVNDNAVNVAINRLKKKIDPAGEKDYIVPVWGVGYKLV
ncbi:MAG: response regulator transcription factor [Sulfurovum sp.]|nr:response regulator transcription factor [Sulfurovum sp.]MDD3592960.1 response regulator transcription factor [Sulfurovum sp.]